MNCIDIKSKINQIGAENAHKDEQVFSHLQECNECLDYCEEAVLREALTQISDVPANLGLQQRVMARIAAEQQRRNLEAPASPSSNDGNKSNPVHWSVSWFAAVALLVVALWLAPVAEQEPQIQLVEVAVGEVQTVRLMLASEQDLVSASIKVSFFGDLSLAAEQKITEVSWQSDLKSGKNLLPIPVYLASPKGGYIEISMETEQGIKKFSFDVAAKQDKSLPKSI